MTSLSLCATKECFLSHEAFTVAIANGMLRGLGELEHGSIPYTCIFWFQLKQIRC